MVKAVLKCAGASDPGLVRHNNEDGFYCDPDRGIFLVVDGIGGQAAGEKAAEIAVARIRARLERQTGTTEQRVRESVAMANNEILRAAASHPEWAGMACVLTLVVLEDGAAVVGHVGDSRLYKIRQGVIEKLTHDHSPVGEREDGGELSEADAMRHPRRNEVFRDVGSEPHQPDDANFTEILCVPFEPDSALLLCSDGLSDQVPSKDIRLIVERRAADPETAARELIDAANLAGGKDNVTVVLVAGEQFRAPARHRRTSTGRAGAIFASRVAIFLYGAALACAAAWLTRSLWQAPPVVIAPRVLTVGAGQQFGTIEEALDMARSGDIVEAAPGEYTAAARLKSGVTLRSRVPRGAVLHTTVLAEAVRGAKVIGLRIAADPLHPLTQGILLVDSEVEVNDVEVSGAGVGIEIRGATSPVVVGNAVLDCAADGILISGPSTPWLSHNSLLRNGRAGVAAHDGANPELVGNVFEKNGLDLPAGANMDAIRQNNFFLNVRPGFLNVKPARGGRKP
jgi:serine/threonine protein phosphatase PrpC